MTYSTLLTTDNAFAVTPDDDAVISAFGFYVGTTGDVAVMPVYQEGQDSPTPVVFVAVPAGAIISLNICRVMETDTTAGDLVAFGPR